MRRVQTPTTDAMALALFHAQMQEKRDAEARRRIWEAVEDAPAVCPRCSSQRLNAPTGPTFSHTVKTCLRCGCVAPFSACVSAGEKRAKVKAERTARYRAWAQSLTSKPKRDRRRG